MKTLAYVTLMIAGYFALQLHRLVTGCASIARYAAFRLIDLAIGLAKVYAFVALVLIGWYLIDPATASARLAGLPALRLWL